MMGDRTTKTSWNAPVAISLLIATSFFGYSIAEDGAIWTAVDLAGDGTAGLIDGTGNRARFAFSQPDVTPQWLSGITFTPDESSVLVVDTWNNAIRQININSKRVTTLVQVQPRGPNPVQDFALSGIAAFGTKVVFANTWNERAGTTNDPRIQVYDTARQVGGLTRLETASFSGSGPNGITVTRAVSGELAYSQRNGGLWELSTVSQSLNHLAGPETITDNLQTKGWNDGTGTLAQMSSPGGVVASSDGVNVYFVDSSRCNVRQVNVRTRVVTTIAGARTGTLADGICTHVNGDSTTARFRNPIGIALVPSAEELLVTEGSHTVRKVNILTGETSDFFGLPNSPGWANGRGLGVQFRLPSGIAATADRIAITDTGNHLVRLIQKTCLPYYILVLGICRLCESPLCPLGSFRAPCRETVVDALCEECQYAKPEFSEWNQGVQDCSWTCNEGYEKTVNGDDCQLQAVLAGRDGGGLSDEAIVAIVAACCGVLIIITGGVLWYIRDMDMDKYFKPKKKEA
eukprot:CAMPEP_0181293004 /NCGR_PEP_ID=MMETSP1101-20121128/2823_1 /TAXON_ID=46948 /ORGANISM="Rhodomonas abbreviata, Strain Caron Lab Isolate" /LENGTH=516 /DNA_ID=CAMNT_0023397541 /DNA_START=165 /DNA_END=1712 /DNA_ORIENTATION=+